jgi:hypothetical protein
VGAHSCLCSPNPQVIVKLFQELRLYPGIWSWACLDTGQCCEVEKVQCCNASSHCDFDFRHDREP